MPHDCPTLLVGPKQSFLITGAGLSMPELPAVSGLETKLKEAATSLGIEREELDKNFQVLSDIVIEKLKVAGKTEGEARLWLANAFGMIADAAWLGGVTVDFAGNTPRHRAIARFAVEKRLRAIVSLNWDTFLEAALESIGLYEGRSEARPWEITAYARVVTDDQLPSLGNSSVFAVVKPHGCVRAIRANWDALQKSQPVGVVTFKLSSADMDHFPGNQTDVDK